MQGVNRCGDLHIPVFCMKQLLKATKTDAIVFVNIETLDVGHRKRSRLFLPKVVQLVIRTLLLLFPPPRCIIIECIQQQTSADFLCFITFL